MDDLTRAVKELLDRLNNQKALEFETFVNRFRKYPNGFEFYYPSTDGEPERSKILGAYLVEYCDIIQVWYKCEVPTWNTEQDVMPLKESVIDRAISKFGIVTSSSTP